MAPIIANPCGVCLRDVTSRHYGVQCRSNCKRWFHKDCAKISTAEYNRLSSDNNQTWDCGRSDCVPTLSASGPTDVMDAIRNLTAAVVNLTDKVDDIKKNDLAEINRNMKAVNSRLEMIENRISESEKRIESLEVKMEALETSEPSVPTCPEDIIGEIEDRSKRARNIIIHNLPESTSRDIQTRISSDKDKLENLFQSVNFETDMNTVKLHRIGKASKDKSRPMKVILNSPSEANSCMELFTPALKGTDPSLSALGVTRDKTIRERQYLNKLRDELDKRTHNGEENLTIKYRNGIPVIMKAPKNV